jgi:hypothetical protein
VPVLSGFFFSLSRNIKVETWYLTLREELTLRVFENRVPLYASPNIIRQIKSRKMRWVGHVARMGEERKCARFLVVNPEGNRPLGRPEA